MTASRDLEVHYILIQLKTEMVNPNEFNGLKINLW